MSFREPNGVVMTVNMKLLGWKTRIAASSLRGRFATNQNGQAAKEKKQNVVAGAGCSENSSGFRLREKCFSLDIPFYRTSEPVICPRMVPGASFTCGAQYSADDL